MGAQFDLGMEEVFKSAQEQSVRYARLGVQRRGGPNLVNNVAGIFKEATVRGWTKPSKMGLVHDAVAFVVPATAQQHQNNAVMANIGRAREHEGAGTQVVAESN